MIFGLRNFVFAEGGVSTRFFSAPNVTEWVRMLYFFGVGIVGVLAVGVIIFAGVQYMSSVGNPEVISRAKTQIAAGIAGLLLILLSYTILHTLDPRLTKLEFKTEKVTLKGASFEEMLAQTAFGNQNQGTRTISVSRFDSRGASRNLEEIERECQLSCPGGQIKVTDLGTCECTGGIEEFPCATDEDCDMECRKNFSEEECKNLILYCKSNGKCGKSLQSRNLDLKPDGAKCKSDQECQTGICDDGKCIRPKRPGESCEIDYECQSGICNKKGKNECTEIGGDPGGKECDLDRPEVCASGVCIDEKRFLRSDKCMRVGGNLYGELCNTDKHCKAGTGLKCCENCSDPIMGVSGPMCACVWSKETGFTRWDAVQQKCVPK